MFSTNRQGRRITITAITALAPIMVGGAALAATSGLLAPPEHNGNPALWGPALEVVCSNPDLARAAGYNVYEGDNTAEQIVGSPAADAIFAYGGNDKVFGGPGDDLICLGAGNDKGRGDQGNDAVFGEGHNDTILGDKGRDFLDGGAQVDYCSGGAKADASDDCETEVSIP